MRVKDVTYPIQDTSTGPATMEEMKKEDTGVNEGSLHLFKTQLDKKIVGNCTFAFRIVVMTLISKSLQKTTKTN